MDTIGLPDLAADLRGMATQLDLDLDLSGVEITEQSSLQGDLDMDSLNLMDLLVHLERKYQVSVADDELSGVETIGDVLALLNGTAVAG